MFENAEIIHSYSRADAINDGALVDITELAHEGGFSAPIAMTQAAWVLCVDWDEANPELQDEEGRLWDVVTMAAHAARGAKQGSRVTFSVLRIPNQRASREWAPAELADLYMVIGPGDTAAAVITIMCEDED